MEEKIEALKELYTDDEILDIIGYYDYSNPDIEYLFTEEEIDMNKVYLYAINNGNFEEVIGLKIIEK